MASMDCIGKRDGLVIHYFQRTLIYHFNMNRILYTFLISIFAFCFTVAEAQTATWIWYPGDFEVWLGNKMQNRRTERGSFLPPFWKLDNHYVLMDFHKVF